MKFYTPNVLYNWFSGLFGLKNLLWSKIFRLTLFVFFFNANQNVLENGVWLWRWPNLYIYKITWQFQFSNRDWLNERHQGHILTLFSSESSDWLARLGEVHHLLQPPPHGPELLSQLLHLLSQTGKQKNSEKVFHNWVNFSKGIPHRK